MVKQKDEYTKLEIKNGVLNAKCFKLTKLSKQLKRKLADMEDCVDVTEG